MRKYLKIGRVLRNAAICWGFYLIAAYLHQRNPTIIDLPTIWVLCGCFTIFGLAASLLALLTD